MNALRERIARHRFQRNFGTIKTAYNIENLGEIISQPGGRDFDSIVSLFDIFSAFREPFDLDRSSNYKSSYDFMELEYNSLDLPPQGAIVVRNERGSTPLVRACYHGFLDIVVKLIDEYHVDIEEMGSIAEPYKMRLRKILLHQKIDPEPPGLARPLYAAAYKHNVDVLKELIKKKALVNGRSITGETALHGACLNGELDAVKILVRNGADLQLIDDNGLTCIMHAARGGSIRVIKYLVQRGQDLNKKNKHGLSALDYYAICHASDAKYLISRSNPESFHSALIMAAANKNYEFVKSCMRYTFRKRCSPKQEFDAYLLLGSSYIDFNEKFTFVKRAYVLDCLREFKKAMGCK